jgi:hypothetical protein
VRLVSDGERCWWMMVSVIDYQIGHDDYQIGLLLRLVCDDVSVVSVNHYQIGLLEVK